MRPLSLVSSLAALAGLCSLACSNAPSTPAKACLSSVDCAAGQICGAQKTCVTPPAHGAATSSGAAAATTSGSAGGSSGGSASSTTGGAATSGGGTTSGSAGATTSGQSAGATTTTTTTTSGTGGGCACSSSCCSQIAGNGLVCPNGKNCYGTDDAGSAFYCNYQSGKCDPFDPCNGNSGVYTCGATAGSSSGGTTGSVGLLAGGLSFAVIGDTRPPSPCQSLSDCMPGGNNPYPTQIITSIYQDIQALSPAPLYAVATGDLMDNSPGTGTASWQIGQYQSAVANFTGLTFPAMGNHECNGTPSSECGPSGPDGTGENYQAFLGLLTTLNINNNGLAYYEAGPFTIAATGQTVKFLMLAANAWDSAQATWFDTALSQATDYTFVVRHEPDDATNLSGWVGITDSDAILLNHPGAVTMRLEGHTHELRWGWGTAADGGAGEAIVGNGGAALDCAGTTSTIYCDYGYLLCQQRTDNSLLCTPYVAMGNVPAPSPAPFAVFQNGAQDGF